MTPLTDADRATLLRLARDGLCRAVRGGRVAPSEHRGALGRKAAAFVTLTVDGALRGCTGSVEPRVVLGRLVPRLAASSALADPRFRPLPASDVERTRIEISVLSPFQSIAAEQLVPGTHGVVIERGSRRGLLLPQVAAAHGFSREQLLEAACWKAGLPRGAWRDEMVAIQAFTADVFAEPSRSLVPS